MSQGQRMTDVLSASVEGNGISIPNTGVDTTVHTSPESQESLISLEISAPQAGVGDATVLIKIAGALVLSTKLSPGAVLRYGPVSMFSPSGSPKKMELSMSGSTVSLIVTGMVEFGGGGRKFR